MTEAEAKQRIESAGKTWEDFIEFMVGQTIGGTPEDPDFYEDDVERFINL